MKLVFFLSGFAAMIYQIVWQRALYAIFGITIESITIVVTAFLLGLGLGSLIGGVLSERPGRRLVLFAAAEFTIGAYGAISLELFHRLGFVGVSVTLFASGLLTISLLLPPTLLMGLTLPLLVAEGVESSRSTGHTVSDLYFANTAGSAVAALVSVILLMPLLGQKATVMTAATINCAIGLFVLGKSKAFRGTK